MPGWYWSTWQKSPGNVVRYIGDLFNVVYTWVKSYDADNLDVIVGIDGGQSGKHYIDGLVQERHNSSALAMELCLSCTNPSVYSDWFEWN